MQKLPEILQMVSAFLPVDMSGQANNGDWVSLRGYGKVGILLFKGAGTAGDDPTITIQQATAVAGTSAKALNFTEIWKKQGTLTSVGTWTKVTQTAANTYTDATSAEVSAMWYVEIDAEQLDVDNGFDCVQVAVADVGTNAQLGCALYFLMDPTYPQETLESAIVD